MNSNKRFVFPKWVNRLTLAIIVAASLAPFYVIAVLGYGANAYTLNVGYSPVQPVPYSHALHAGQLGIDCRYCHNTVERAGFAAVPPTQTCMNCHTHIYPDAAVLEPIRDSYKTGKPVPWIKIHDLPDYVYFNHSAHVNAGVSCVECHGHVNHMTQVYQAQPLNMAWCLSCHRNPETHLRPRNEVTNLDWVPTKDNLKADLPEISDQQASEFASNRLALGTYLKKKYNVIHSTTDCVTCHR